MIDGWSVVSANRNYLERVNSLHSPHPSEYQPFDVILRNRLTESKVIPRQSAASSPTNATTINIPDFILVPILQVNLWFV